MSELVSSIITCVHQSGRVDKGPRLDTEELDLGGKKQGRSFLAR
jgi:hypothetical protein